MTKERDVNGNDRRQELLSNTPVRLMVGLSLPAIVGMVVIGLYTFVDAIYAGQLIGVNAMGAVSVAYPFTFINSGIACLIGMGSASVLSRAVGAKDKATIDKIMGNLIVMNVVLSLASTIVVIAFAPQLLSLVGVENEMLDLAVSYIRVVFVGSLLVNFGQSSNMVMRGEGNMVRAMTIMGGGAVLNMILSPIFIIGFRDAGFGIQGAAAATVLSQLVVAAVMLWWFVRKEKVCRIHRVTISGDVLGEVVKVGVSAMLMQVLTLVYQAVVYRVAAEWGGSEWQVLFGAALRYQAFAFIPLWGMSNGLQPAVGTNYGAAQFARVRRILLTFCIGATVLSLVFWIPAMVSPSSVLGLFITDPSLIEMGVSDFQVFFCLYITYGLMIMAITYMQSIGDGGKAALLTIARSTILFIPLVLAIPQVAGLGIHGVWLACMLSDGLVMVLSVAMMLVSAMRLGKGVGSKKDQMVGDAALTLPADR